MSIASWAFLTAWPSPRAWALLTFSLSFAISAESMPTVSSARWRASGSVRFHSSSSAFLIAESSARTRASRPRIASRGTFPRALYFSMNPR